MPSAPAVPRSIPLEHRWFPARGPAQLFGNTGADSAGHPAQPTSLKEEAMMERRDQPASPGLSCPVPHSGGDRILLAHGEGARLTRRLIRQLLLEALDHE